MNLTVSDKKGLSMREINPYLKEVEKYLVDLPILDRNKIISDLNSEILENRNILMQPASITADHKRIENGFDAYLVKNSSSSFGKVIFKTLAVMFICFLLFLTFLIWKFTPLFEIDEKNQKVTILGGLIDLDGKAGKFIIGNEVHFTVSNYTNDLTGSIPTSPSARILNLDFESGKFELETSLTTEVSFECKLSSPPTQEMIKDSNDSINLNFTELEGSNCTIRIPENLKVLARGETAAFELREPLFDIDLALESGNVSISPKNSRTYFYDLTVNSGHLEEFSGSSKESAEHIIRVKLESGNISR